MDFVIDLIEVILELYVALFECANPDKGLSKGKRILLKLFCAIVIVLILISIVLGIYLIIGGSSTELIVGFVLLGLAGIGLIAHIIIAIHNIKKKKNISEPLNKDDMDNLYKQ